jgi:hypothetical protein
MKKFLLAFMGFGMISMASIAQADLIALYPWEPDDNVFLFNYDADTNEYEFDSVVGSTGLVITFSLARNPADGQIYALGSMENSDPYHPRSLYRLDADNYSAVELIQELEASDGNRNANAMAIAPNGDVFISYQSGVIDRFDLATETSTQHAEIPDDWSIFAIGLVYDYDAGRLIVAVESDPVQLLAVDGAGNVTPLFNFFTPGNDEGCSAQAMAYEGNGTIVASSTFGCDLLYRIDLDAESVSLIAQPNGTPESSLKSLALLGDPPVTEPVPPPLAVPVFGAWVSLATALLLMAMAFFVLSTGRKRG